MADKRGFVTKHNLEVEFVNYIGSTDLLLEAILAGKADACLGMILRWLKPMEQGADEADLLGKRLGVGGISSV